MISYLISVMTSNDTGATWQANLAALALGTLVAVPLVGALAAAVRLLEWRKRR